MVYEYDRRRQFIVDGLSSIEGVRCLEPAGAFYVFPDVSSFGLSSVDMAKYLLEEAKVVTVPGDAFGPSGEGFLRLSYASPMPDLTDGLERLRDGLQRLLW
jgi:aspartate/methionine/tyrosine aminotransferase